MVLEWGVARVVINLCSVLNTEWLPASMLPPELLSQIFACLRTPETQHNITHLRACGGPSTNHLQPSPRITTIEIRSCVDHVLVAESAVVWYDGANGECLLKKPGMKLEARRRDGFLIILVHDLSFDSGLQ